MMSNQQQTYQGVVGVQQAQPPGLLNSQRNNMGGQMQNVMGVQQAQPPGLLSNQRSGMGSQMQGLMVQYTPLPSYQVGTICCCQGGVLGGDPDWAGCALLLCLRDGAKSGDLRVSTISCCRGGVLGGNSGCTGCVPIPVLEGWSQRWGFAHRACLERAHPCGDLWDTSGTGLGGVVPGRGCPGL